MFPTWPWLTWQLKPRPHNLITANLLELQKYCWWPPCELAVLPSYTDPPDLLTTYFFWPASLWCAGTEPLSSCFWTGQWVSWQNGQCIVFLTKMTNHIKHQKCCRKFWYWRPNNVPNNIDGFAVQWENRMHPTKSTKLGSLANLGRITDWNRGPWQADEWRGDVVVIQQICIVAELGERWSWWLFTAPCTSAHC